jgi:hypothetical protein
MEKAWLKEGYLMKSDKWVWLDLTRGWVEGSMES